jgi:hypothetical protein
MVTAMVGAIYCWFCVRCFVVIVNLCPDNRSALLSIDMANSVNPNDVDVFLDNAAWTICSTYHTVPKASPGASIFGQDMLFNILFVADWHKIGEHRQSWTDQSNQHKNT